MCTAFLEATVQDDARLPLDTRTRPWREWWPSYHKDSKAQSDEEAVQPWESWKFDPASPFDKPWYGGQ